MAKKVYIDFELRYKEAVANLNEMQKEYTKLETKVEKFDDAVQESSESTKEMGGVLDSVTGGAVTKFKGLTSTVGNVVKGFKSLRIAIIATGIGALALAIGAVIAAFTRSEEGQDRFTKILNVIGAVIGVVMDRLADFGMMLIDVFSQPGKIWQGFVDTLKKGYEMIKLQVIDRFRANFTLLVGGIQKGILKMRIAWNKFTGDSKEAKKLTNELDKVNAKMDEARKTISRANESLSSEFDRISRLVAQGRDDLKDYLADLNREIEEEGRIMARASDIAAAARKQERKLQIERAKADREIAAFRELAADKENKSVEERIEAIKRAGAIEEEMTNKEVSLAAKRLEVQRIKNRMGHSTREDKDEEARLEAQLIELETRRLKLQKALTAEITTALREAKAERNAEAAELAAEFIYLPGVGFVSREAFNKMKADGESIEKIQEEFKKKKEDEAAETEVQKVELERNRKLQELDDLNATEEQKAKIREFYSDKLKKAEFADAEARKQQKELEAKEEEERTQELFGNLISIVGANSRFGKGLAAANAIRSTYAGASKALEQGGMFGFVSAAAIIASGLRNVKTILATKDPKTPSIAGASGGGSEPAISIPATPAASQPPQFNTVGASGINQLADVLGGGQQPVRAFVVSGDVTTAQQLDRNIVSSASIG
ncbi:MAG: hypothetical protein GOVbin2950_33 [Prokaryotic dsDNA virus sp.]|nr:MAG: hypothetical protein GOVbin2950_33 [Prokaryotic dsDNA virus sp.]